MKNRSLSPWLLLAVMVAALAGTLSLTQSTEAITGGEEDGNAHPHVVMIIFEVDGELSHRCTGTLISPTVVLTAGHCTFETSGARVYTGAEITDRRFPSGGGVQGETFTHPAFDNFATFPNTSDVGIVVLKKPIKLDVYGTLPDLGLLDALGNGTEVDAVGYGLQSVVPDLQQDLVRYATTTNIINLTSANNAGVNVQLQEDAGNGNNTGGTCFGDSGGPIFIAGTNVIAAIVSFGLNQNCVGTGFHYRADIENTQDFVNAFLGGDDEGGNGNNGNGRGNR